MRSCHFCTTHTVVVRSAGDRDSLEWNKNLDFGQRSRNRLRVIYGTNYRESHLCPPWLPRLWLRDHVDDEIAVWRGRRCKGIFSVTLENLRHLSAALLCLMRRFSATVQPLGTSNAKLCSGFIYSGQQIFPANIHLLRSKAAPFRPRSCSGSSRST